jgi:hypothetical protein
LHFRKIISESSMNGWEKESAKNTETSWEKIGFPLSKLATMGNKRWKTNSRGFKEVQSKGFAITLWILQVTPSFLSWTSDHTKQDTEYSWGRSSQSKKKMVDFA